MPEERPVAVKAMEVAPRTGSNYPPELARIVAGREKRPLGDRFGLEQFGVNLTVMAPGAVSSLRHWHEREDEFIYVLDGEVTLIDNAGEHLLTPGMCAGFKAGTGNGHQLANRTATPVSYLEVGTRSPDERVTYSDVDLKGEKVAGKYLFTRKDGSAY
jgi:uncharacterized cupin superfamily protein